MTASQAELPSQQKVRLATAEALARSPIAMHGTRLAGLLRASSAEVWPAISSRSRATTLLGTTAFLGFSRPPWLAPTRRQLRRM